MVLAYAVVCLLAAGHAAVPLFYPGAIMRDTDGNIIRAHQPHVYSENGSFYLIGSAHVGESDGARRNPLSNRGSPLEVTGGLRRPLIRRSLLPHHLHNERYPDRRGVCNLNHHADALS